MDPLHEESTEFWARRFAGGWYRGPAHLQNDFRRFATAYRVPAVARAEVQARARVLLEAGGVAEAPRPPARRGGRIPSRE